MINLILHTFEIDENMIVRSPGYLVFVTNFFLDLGSADLKEIHPSAVNWFFIAFMTFYIYLFSSTGSGLSR